MIVTEPRAGIMEKEPLVSSEKLNRLSDPSSEEKHQHSEDQRQDSAKELDDAIIMNGHSPTDEREEEHKVRFGELPNDGKHVTNRRGSILLSKKKGKIVRLDNQYSTDYVILKLLRLSIAGLYLKKL